MKTYPYLKILFFYFTLCLGGCEKTNEFYTASGKNIVNIFTKEPEAGVTVCNVNAIECTQTDVLGHFVLNFNPNKFVLENKVDEANTFFKPNYLSFYDHYDLPTLWAIPRSWIKFKINTAEPIFASTLSSNLVGITNGDILSNINQNESLTRVSELTNYGDKDLYLSKMWWKEFPIVFHFSKAGDNYSESINVELIALDTVEVTINL